MAPLACAALVACRLLAPSGSMSGALIPTDEIRGDFALRQQIRFARGDVAASFDVVIQKLCDELLVVALTPFGRPALVIRQRGRAVSVESSSGWPWPIEPERVLLDLHRALFIASRVDLPADGTHDTPHQGEVVRDRWSQGAIRERLFLSANTDGAIRVLYRGAHRGPMTASEIEFSNPLLGYALHIDNLSTHELDCLE